MDLFARYAEMRTITKVLSLARANRLQILGVAVLGLASAVFESIGLAFVIPLVALVTDGQLDLGIPVIGPILRWLDASMEIGSLQMLAIVLALFFMSVVVAYLSVVSSSVLAMRFAHWLRTRVFETALSHPLARFESLPSGKFINNIATNTWSVCDALFIIIRLTVDLVTLAVFLAFLLLLSPFYSVLLIGFSLAMGMIVQRATRSVRQLGAQAVAANEGLMAYIWDATAGLRVIRGFGREAHERQRFGDRSERVRATFVRMQILAGVVGPITQVATVAMIGSILAVAALRGDDMATLAGFLAIAYRTQPRVSAVLEARTQLRGMEAPVDEIAACLEAAPSDVPPATEAYTGLQRGLVLHNISARYPQAQQPALTDITCTIPFGSVTAVAGYSGAGKSTLVALLLRFIKPESGQILVDGVEIERIRPADWHRRIAFVEQNAFLFNASVRDNIAYGDLYADDEAIVAAAQAAQADDFVRSLPQGYATMIGESGIRLSQGQRQRVALARSLLRDPDVLILDEATNALDAPTERALRSIVEGGKAGRAIIVIAHRRETIETADQVLVIDKGRLVQAGTPAELLEQRGVFAQLYRDTLGD